ncbi:hypothetical protein [Natronococcus wangiae]|uniref:hypothetical protein n=1 Tax=Natronococcus wangiae TaxID=3068275 RepID=UPI00273FF9EA|nr:hypothetical protein [Natronococcus sp. AD5]
MKRRSFFGVIGGISGVALAGCLGDDEGERRSASGDGDQSSSEENGQLSGEEREAALREEEDDACADVEHDITVSLPPEVPDDATVIGAEAEGLTEIDAVAAALAEASDAYSEEMENNDGHVWLADGQDEGELFDELGGSVGYVAYEGVTYAVETYRAHHC